MDKLRPEAIVGRSATEAGDTVGETSRMLDTSFPEELDVDMIFFEGVWSATVGDPLRDGRATVAVADEDAEAFEPPATPLARSK